MDDSLKDKVITITNKAFQKFLKECNRKPNKLWVDKSSEVKLNNFRRIITKENLLLLKDLLER